MNNLIAIHQSTFNGENIQTVNARELHQFLQVGRDFSSWIKSRIEQYDFVENVDFIIIKKPQQNQAPQNGGAYISRVLGGQERIEYFITLDMAKELSMVERNERGKQARKYFIECEKKAQQVALPNAKELALMVIQAEEEKERLALENQHQAEIIEAQAPKVAFVDKFVDGSKLYSITEASKILNFKRKDFIDCLTRDKYLYRTSNVLVPYETPKCKKLFDVKTGVSEWGRNFTQTKITAQGLNYFSDIYSTELMEVA